ncbi:MAG: hypothetical protein CSA58_10900, partial [Micrococcales bacterium]
MLVLGAIVVVVTLLAEVWTDVLWFKQLGYTQVFRTRLVWQLLLFLFGGGLVAAAVAASLVFAYRKRPLYAPITMQQSGTERYRESIEPLRRLLSVAIPAGLGLFAGSAALAEWRTVLLFFNRQSFGTTDPQFGRDIGFYVFQLPFWEFLLGMVTAALVMSLIAASVTHYLYGGIRLSGRGAKVTPVARAHVGLLLAAVLVAQGASYWLARYTLLLEDNERITGATYTGIRAVLPTRTALAIIALLIAVLFVYAAFRGAWRLPALGVVLMLMSALVLGGLYPAAVEQFQVRPSALTLEPQYLQRGIESTRSAYGLDGVEHQGYRPESAGKAGALQEEAQTAASIRLIDPALVSPAFKQLQRIKQYYSFADSLDVDRYDIDGERRDTVIAVRELNIDGLPADQQTWVNLHTVYTHGYGVVAAYGNQREPDGSPKFFQKGIPTEGDLGEYEPRIYFGESLTQFSVVGAEEGSDPKELDYPADDEAGTGTVQNTFSGNGGPSIGNPINRLLYAIKFRDQNILLTDSINSKSQILYDRTPRDRVQKVAPFLTLDGDPYPAVVDGRVKWIVDAFTTSDRYPYSQLMPLGDATQDSLSATTTSVATVRGEVNYIRNSVKAVVDAYDGSVDLYAWDEDDPVLKAWKSALPGVIKPMSEVSGPLMEHLRYPEDLFKVQRDIMARYHVSDARVFYQASDFWKVPNDPNDDNNNKQPPFYLTLRMPGQKAASFSLTTDLIPAGARGSSAEILTGFLAVDGDAGAEAGKRVDTYGTLRLLELPEGQRVAGPGQARNDFDADPVARETLALLERGNSNVLFGNLLTLPIADGMLYVQPVYV